MYSANIGGNDLECVLMHLNSDDLCLIQDMSPLPCASAHYFDSLNAEQSHAFVNNVKCLKQICF